MEEILTRILRKLDSIERRLDEMEGQEDVLRVKDVARICQLSESRVRHLVQDGEIPYHRNERGGIAFSRKEVTEWRLGRRVPTSSETASRAATRIVMKDLERRGMAGT